MKNWRQCLLICCSLMLLPMTSSFAEGTSTTDKQIKVDELLQCLKSMLPEPDDVPTRADLWADCRNVGTYDAKDKNNDQASYAMGVSLQKKLLANHASFDLVDFINGLLDARSSSVKMTDATIANFLKTALLNDAEASQQYLEEFAEKDNVFDVSGVFYRNISHSAEGDNLNGGNSESDSSQGDAVRNTSAFTEKEICREVGMTENTLQVRFYRVKPIKTIFSNNDLLDIPVKTESTKGIECIAYQADGVIRGWRMLVDKLTVGDLYDVLIPSDLAYGATGVSGQVEGGENLRFLMLVQKGKGEEKEQQASTDE